MPLRTAIPVLLLVSLCAGPALRRLTAQEAPTAATAAPAVAAPHPRAEQRADGPRAPEPFATYQPAVRADSTTAGAAAAADQTTITISTVALAAIIVLLLILILD